MSDSLAFTDLPSPLDHNVCAVCSQRVYGSKAGIPKMFCAGCYHTFNDDILGNADWVRFVVNAERQRRKKRKRMLTLVEVEGKQLPQAAISLDPALTPSSAI